MRLTSIAALFLALTCLLWLVAARKSSPVPKPSTISTISLSDFKARRALALGFNLGRAAIRSDLGNSDAFWVFGHNGVHIVDTTGKVLTSISKDSLCRRREACPPNIPPGSPSCTVTNDCSWGDAKTDGQYVFATNTEDDKLVVFDIYTAVVVAMIDTCGYPYAIDTAEWRDEVYVHCWRPNTDDDGSIDVFSTNAFGLSHPQARAVFNMSAFTHGYLTLDVAAPGVAYSTNFNDPGIHKVSLNADVARTLGSTRPTSFINLTSVGCAGCGAMVMSGHNLHGYVQCFAAGLRANYLVEIDLVTDQVVFVHSEVSGLPSISPDGKMVVTLNAAQDRVHTLRVGGNAQKADDAAIQDILPGFTKGGLSRMAFVQNAKGASFAIISSVLDNYVQVLNLDTFALTALALPVPNDGNTSATTGHGASRAVMAGLSAADNKMYAMVAASRMDWAHTATLGEAANRGEVSVVSTASNIDVQRLVWAPKAAPSTLVTAQAGGAQSTAAGASHVPAAASSDYEQVAVAGLVMACLALLVGIGLVAHRVYEGMRGGSNPEPGSGCLSGITGAQSTAYVPYVEHEMGGYARKV